LANNWLYGPLWADLSAVADIRVRRIFHCRRKSAEKNPASETSAEMLRIVIRRFKFNCGGNSAARFYHSTIYHNVQGSCILRPRNDLLLCRVGRKTLYSRTQCTLGYAAKMEIFFGSACGILFCRNSSTRWTLRPRFQKEC